MKKILCTLLFFAVMGFTSGIRAQTTTENKVVPDSTQNLEETYRKKLAALEKQRIIDSITQANLERELQQISTKQQEDQAQELAQAQLDAISKQENVSLERKKRQIDSLKKTTTGYPVIGFFGDTLFQLYNRLGSFSPRERSLAISSRIKNLASEAEFTVDSLLVQP
ncbi:MAG: mechanosensitive ion channel family protein, partial [Marinirhabdus sp.]|nr:mechanosensitive ion channel family protein [Marinirhabdus sp.]